MKTDVLFRLASASLPVGHFSHVIVDEAGHAIEPELLICVAGILNVDPHVSGGCGQLVLAGDPKQLGPILRSPFAIKYGLGKHMILCIFKITGPLVLLLCRTFKLFGFPIFNVLKIKIAPYVKLIINIFF